MKMWRLHDGSQKKKKPVQQTSSYFLAPKDYSVGVPSIDQCQPAPSTMSSNSDKPKRGHFTLVFIKPLSQLQQKETQTNENNISTGKIATKEVDLYNVLKNDGFGDYSSTDGTDNESVNDQKAAEDDVGSGPESGATVNKNKLASNRLASSSKKSKVDDPHFALYYSDKLFVNEYAIAVEEKNDEGNVNKDINNKDNQTKVDKSTALLEAPDGPIVLNNEIIRSTRNCTVNLDTEKRLLQALAAQMQAKCEMENVFFMNEYMIKFNVNITFGHEFSYKRFEQLVYKVFHLMIVKDARKLIVEVPLDVITGLNKSLINDNIANMRTHVKPSFINWMQIELKISKKFLVVYFCIDSRKRIHRLDYSFSSIKQMILEKYRNMHRIYFDITYVPLLFYADLDERQQKMLENSFDKLNVTLNWRRSVNFTDTVPPAANTKLNGQHSYYYQKAQHHSQYQYQSQEECLIGMSKSVCLEVDDKTIILDKLILIAHICKGISKNFNFYIANMYQTKASINFHTIKNLLVQRQLPFSTYFACMVLFTGSYKIADSLKNDNSLYTFLDTVKRESETNSDALEQCLYYLKIQCKQMSIVNIYSEFMKLLANQARFAKQKTPMNEGYVLIRRATLSPTSLELMQPIPLLKSRFSTRANLDYAIRLTILDDNNRKLNNNCKSIHDTQFIKDSIKLQLLNGISIGDRLYEFLGSSSSQMRENGVIMYALDRESRNAQNIRDLAGDLSKFNLNVAKYVARFGLMFSQAMTIVEVQEKIYIIEDFLGEVKPDFKNFTNEDEEKHIFSDGVGIISRSVAEKFVPYLSQLRPADYFPSAFQIRYGGCKGMLVVYPIAKPAIVFRDSMNKYESQDNFLGIVKYSMSRPVFLNRPLINILDQLNVHRDELYHYFEQSTCTIAKALLYDSCALQLIKTYTNSHLPYDRIVQSGISLLEEPFLRNIINYLIYYRLNELKSRARIRIPFENGRMAFGVIDETQTLNYGEVYFQYTKMSKEGLLTAQTDILEGEVMVTKFPCLQPGDVRKLKAVKVNALSHIKDCLVFPAKGERPHPDEMGGSDLDGDEYAVFWDTKLMFPGGNFNSMTFPYGMAKDMPNYITIDDIVEFYCNFLMMNNIGQVANTHLIYSDYHPKGLFSEECHDLAIKYSISLDYQKTGIIEDFPREYLLNIRPDFMERFGTDKVYLSRRILGQFYRHCSLIERIVELSQFDVIKSSNTRKTKNPKFILLGWKRFYTEAEEAFLEYKLRIVQIMEQLDIESEVVLFSDVYEDKSDVSRVLVLGLFKYFRVKFASQCDQANKEERLLCISAWYAICFEKCFTYNGKLLLGLPWIVADEMCQLALLNNKDKHGNATATEHSSKSAHEINHILEDSEDLEEWKNVHIESHSKPMAHSNTSVVLHYWNSTIIVTQLKLANINTDHLIDIQHQLVETQLKVTLNLVMKWFDRIKKDIYQDREDDQLIQMAYYPTTLKEESSLNSFTEEKLLRAFIMKKLKQINLECARNNLQNEPNKSLPTISTLFNEFMMYLFEICNRVNYYICHGKLEEMFLLKYAVFALSFLNKLDSKLDRLFYHQFLSDFERNQKCYFLKEILAQQRKGDPVNSFLSVYPLNFSTENVYQKYLDSLFESYLSNNANLVHETVRFNLLPTNLKIDLKKVKETFVQKLFFLTGLDNIEFEYTKDQQKKANLMSDHLAASVTSIIAITNSPNIATVTCSSVPKRYQTRQFTQSNRSQATIDGRPSTANNNNQDHDGGLAEMERNQYTVKTTGLVHSIMILRLLFGHPDFFPQICDRFNIIPMNIEKDNETSTTTSTSQRK